MAKSWSGFRPQNELVKLFWEALEASQSEKVRLLKSFDPPSATETDSAEDEPEPLVRPGFIPLR